MCLARAPVVAEAKGSWTEITAPIVSLIEFSYVNTTWLELVMHQVDSLVAVRPQQKLVKQPQ